MSAIAKNLFRVAHVHDIEDGEMESFEIGDEEILICRVGDSFYAINAICTHACVELCDGELDGYYVTCPLHFAQFDIRNGVPQGPPAKEPLEVYELQIIDDEIFVKL